MAAAPTYADLDREKQQAQIVQQQQMEQAQRAKQAEIDKQNEANPMLQAYMNSQSQQGLMPNRAVNEYSATAGLIAEQSPDQMTYSHNMVNAALKGQLDLKNVLEDESVLPEMRNALMETLDKASGLGQLR